MENIFDVVIIGSGIAGLSAAIYSKRLGFNSIVIGNEPGGTLMNASLIENYPGFSKISGKGLIKKVEEHLQNYNPNILNDTVEKIKKQENKFLIKTKKEEVLGKTIIFCTGSEWKKINIPGEKEFLNKGVHYCALCDGFFYKEKTIAVLGGGDSATKEAILLSKYAKKTYLITRGKLNAEPINIKKIKKEKIEIIENTEVIEIKGEKFVNSIVLDKEFNGSNVLNVDGVFVEIGRTPISELAISLGVKTNEEKEIIIDKESKTNVQGIYAAGDVTDNQLKQAITGVGEAVKASYSAYKYLNNKKTLRY